MNTFKEIDALYSRLYVVHFIAQLYIEDLKELKEKSVNTIGLIEKSYGRKNE